MKVSIWLCFLFSFTAYAELSVSIYLNRPGFSIEENTERYMVYEADGKVWRRKCTNFVNNITSKNQCKAGYEQELGTLKEVEKQLSYRGANPDISAIIKSIRSPKLDKEVITGPDLYTHLVQTVGEVDEIPVSEKEMDSNYNFEIGNAKKCFFKKSSASYSLSVNNKMFIKKLHPLSVPCSDQKAAPMVECIKYAISKAGCSNQFRALDNEIKPKIESAKVSNTSREITPKHDIQQQTQKQIIPAATQH